MVDILIDGITTLELVCRTTILEVVDLTNRLTCRTHQHLTILVDSDRSSLATWKEFFVDIVAKLFASPFVTFLHINKVFVSVLVNTLIFQTKDRAERVTNLNTVKVRTTLTGFPLRVDRLEHALVHCGNLIEVLRNIEVCTHREFAYSNKLVSLNIKFPSLVLHITNIAPSKSTETIG